MGNQWLWKVVLEQGFGCRGCFGCPGQLSLVTTKKPETCSVDGILISGVRGQGIRFLGFGGKRCRLKSAQMHACAIPASSCMTIAHKRIDPLHLRHFIQIDLYKHSFSYRSGEIYFIACSIPTRLGDNFLELDR